MESSEIFWPAYSVNGKLPKSHAPSRTARWEDDADIRAGSALGPETELVYSNST